MNLFTGCINVPRIQSLYSHLRSSHTDGKSYLYSEGDTESAGGTELFVSAVVVKGIIAVVVRPRKINKQYKPA